MRAKAKKTRRQSTSTGKRDPCLAYVEGVLDGRIIAGPHVRNACRRHLADLDNGRARGLYFDLDAALWAVNFFPDVLHLAGGHFEGRRFDLQPSQAFIVGSLFGWKRADGTRRFRRAYIEEGKGNGKALALDTPIATPSGWSNMGDLRVADQVLGEDGRPTTILAVSDVHYRRPCFRLRFDDGEEIIADAGHEWLTLEFEHGRRLRTTAQIAASLRRSNDRYQAASHAVILAAPLDLEAADLPVPPYTMGAWLGDGDSDCARLTCAYSDGQVLREIEAEGVTVSERVKHSATTGRFLLGSAGRSQAARNVSLQSRLRALGVLGHKHIPAIYLRSSVEQRRALLAGLLDSDGTIAESGQAELTLCLRRLALDALELIRSLGMKPTMREAAAMLEGREVGRRHRIQFWPFGPTFRLARKAARVPAAGRQPLAGRRLIVECDPVPSVPVKCIAVDNASKLYLAGRAMIPTHNSPLAAGVGLYCMVADGEARAEVYAAASKKDQAMVLFRDAVAMVDQSPGLTTRIVKSGTRPVWNLADPKSGSFMKPIASEDGQSGPRPSCALCDEIHEHRDGTVIEMLERGFKWRRQPLLMMITNSGTDRNSACWQEHEHAVQVAAGTKTPGEDFAFVGDPEFVGESANDHTFAYVCALDKSDDPLKDPNCWIKANPLLDVTMTREKLAEAVSQARAIPGKLNGILRLHFCVWTDAEQAWMGRLTLESVLAEFEPSDHAGKDTYVGADLSGSQDLTALGFCVPTGTVTVEREGTPVELPTYDAWVEVWTPKDTLAERSLRDKAPYEVWAKGGWLNAVEGRNIRLDFVAARLAEANTEFRIVMVAYDRYSYRNLENEMNNQGLTLPQVEHPQGGVKRAKPTPEQIEDAKRSGREPPQGLWMPGSVLAIETLMLERRIRIKRNPVLISAMMSASLEHDPFDNRWFSKRKAVNRIDALVALTMAVGAATQAPVDGSSVYETRGLLII